MVRKSIVVVLGIIKNKKGEVLLSLRDDPKFPGAHLKWDLIGGKVEMGESLEETLIREIKEETNLKIKIKKFLPHTICKNWDFPDYFQHTLLFCYECKKVSGKLKSNDKKIKELKWVKTKEALKMDLIFSAREYLKFLRKIDTSFLIR
jgi:8-oxo-dGTP diphosphatase